MKLRELQRLAEAQGWRIVRKSKHDQWFSPDGKSIYTVPRTNRKEGTGRTLANALAELRRGGLEV